MLKDKFLVRPFLPIVYNLLPLSLPLSLGCAGRTASACALDGRLEFAQRGTKALPSHNVANVLHRHRLLALRVQVKNLADRLVWEISHEERWR